MLNPSFYIPDKLVSSTPKQRSIYQTSELTLTLPKCIDFKSINWTSVGDAGARISSPKSGVSVTVPQGAVAAGQTTNVYVGALDGVVLRLSGDQAAVTPIVQCGTMDGRPLAKPVVLSMPHAGAAAKTSLLFCPDIDSEERVWEAVRLNERIDSDGVFMQTDSSMVHLVTSQLGAYVVVSSRSDASAGTLTASSSAASTLSSQQPLLG
jgi:leucine-rich repeat transmembrane protein FLRT